MTASTRRAALGAILAAPLVSVPAVAVPPSSLADACLWASKHRAWIDLTASDERWTDERLDAESSRVDAVITRAITEPSRTWAELAAKASLALEDYERFTALPGTELDDGERIVLTVLREAAGLCA